ncbi:MAG: helix-turn-helix domain-containing protein [Planctomycetota bacterium]
MSTTIKRKPSKANTEAVVFETPATKPHAYALKLAEDRHILIELPASSIAFGPDGDLLLRPEAVRLLERARAALSDMPDQPSKGMIRRFREAMSLTQKELGDAIGVDKLTVSRWERGEIRPRLSAVKAMRKLRAKRARTGLAVDGR